jgi:hypothetical protein
VTVNPIHNQASDRSQTVAQQPSPAVGGCVQEDGDRSAFNGSRHPFYIARGYSIRSLEARVTSQEKRMVAVDRNEAVKYNSLLKYGQQDGAVFEVTSANRAHPYKVSALDRGMHAGTFGFEQDGGALVEQLENDCTRGMRERLHLGSILT